MTPLETIRDGFRRLMGWEGPELWPVDFALAAYLCTFLPGARERTWGLLVSAAAAGKTEILRCLRDYDPKRESPRRTVELSDLTENAFASAYRSEEHPDEDMSLLHRLDARRNPTGPKVLVVKELTTVLTLPRERRSRLFGQLRSAYDGDYDNHAGQIGHVYYELGFGFVAACTEVIDDVRKQDQPLGERIILCRMGSSEETEADRKAIALSALTQDPRKKDKLREEIRHTACTEMERIIQSIFRQEKFAIVQPPEMIDRLASLASVITRMRSVPISAQTYASQAEKPARLAQQLQTWADARAAFDNRTSWNAEDYSLLTRLGRDTLPPDFLQTLRLLWGRGPDDVKSLKPDQLRGADETMHRQINQWVRSGFLVDGVGMGTYTLPPDVIAAVENAKLLEGLDPLDFRG